MSISVIFPGPRSDSDERYNFPVLTEDYFRTILQPLAQEKNLFFIDRLGLGIDLSLDGVDVFQKELNVAIESVLDGSERSEHVHRRLVNLSLEIDRIFKERPNATIFIG